MTSARIEVYYKGQLALSQGIDVPGGPLTPEAFTHRQALIKVQAERIRVAVSRVLGPDIQAYVVFGSSMNHHRWHRLSKFDDVLEYLEEKKAG